MYIHIHILLYHTVDWDWNWSTEGQLRFNATTISSKDGTPKTTPRVAELAVFAPDTFQHLRNSVFGVSEEEYRQSMFGAGPFISFQSNSKGAARVGGVFFFTRDGAYMIKTIKVRNILSSIREVGCILWSTSTYIFLLASIAERGSQNIFEDAAEIPQTHEALFSNIFTYSILRNV